MQKLEHPYKPIPINTLKNSNAIVVLSGMVHQVGDEDYYTFEFSDPDRFFGGLDLINRNKSDKIIFTGGTLSWTVDRKSEGNILRNKAISLGVEEKKILVTTKVKNTYEESVAVTKLIPNNSFITLVTSAYHMQRSRHLFENQGFEVTSFPVDFKSSNDKISILSFLPNIEALDKTSLFIRENIGRFYYKLIL